MSLKAFHVFFIAVTIAMCVGVGVWGVRHNHDASSGMPLYLGIFGFVGAAGLAIYGVWFLKKLKRLSYV